MGYPCNVRCTFCNQADYSTKRVLDRRIWSEALLPAYEVVRGINMQGGEPTVSNDCRELLQLLLDTYPNVRLALMTNSDYRDCGITCIHNPFPTGPRTAQLRKVAFKATRDPWLYLKKAHNKRKRQNNFRKLKEV